MRKGAARLLLLILVVGGLAAAGRAGGLFDGGELPAAHRPSASPTAVIGGTYRRGDLDELLAQTGVIAVRPAVSGYDRQCGTGHACDFGQPWTDDVEVQLGHNGCGTRDDILAVSLTRVAFRPGTHGCVVESGVLSDPYTGHRISFRKQAAYEVGIDHLVPLALAWDLGASQWSLERRTDFANDPRNLVAVSGQSNSSKSDHGPGEWLPLNAGFRCQYVDRYLKVTIAYHLPITRADHDAVTALRPFCDATPSARG